MYKDCIYKQKQLEREELDGENESNGEKELDAEKLDKQPTRKRKQIKVYMYAVQFLTGHIIFGPTYRLTIMLRIKRRNR